MTDYPSESSLVVNATQQQLSGSPFTGGVAISPSQREEAKGNEGHNSMTKVWIRVKDRDIASIAS